MNRTSQLNKELKEIQDELVARGVLDIKFCWNEQSLLGADKDDVKEEIIKLLRSHLNGEVKPLEYIGDRNV